MNKEKIVIVDYGLGNLYSVQRALEHCGADEVQVSSKIDDIEQADKLILPGVGAFEDGMRGLHSLGLTEAIKQHANANKPLLGICLGMQLLATSSAEFGHHQGLNLIPGRVVPIPVECEDGTQRKIPFIGWSGVIASSKQGLEESIMNNITPEMEVYLVHSYHFLPDDPNHLLAIYDFQGTWVTAAVKHKNIHGLQFHPEKSGKIGLTIIKNFIESKN